MKKRIEKKGAIGTNTTNTGSTIVSDGMHEIIAHCRVCKVCAELMGINYWGSEGENHEGN